MFTAVGNIGKTHYRLPACTRGGALRTMTARVVLLAVWPWIASACGAAEPHAILDVADGCLFGASKDHQWVSSRDARVVLRGGENYELFGLRGSIARVRGAKPEPMGEQCEGELEVPLSASPLPAAATIAIEAPVWKVMPRPIEALGLDGESYRSVARQILDTHGMRNASVRLTQVLRTDLDGDGVDEVLIVATSAPAGREGTGLDSSSRAGDYSFVAVRRIVKGKVRTLLLRHEFHAKDGEFDAPNVYAILAVADLNGDGVMEIVVQGRYFEGEWGDIFQLKGDAFVKALSCGCGS